MWLLQVPADGLICGVPDGGNEDRGAWHFIWHRQFWRDISESGVPPTIFDGAATHKTLFTGLAREALWKFAGAGQALNSAPLLPCSADHLPA